MKAILFVSVVLVLGYFCEASKLVHHQLSVYRELLSKLHPDKGDVVDVESIKTLMTMFDGDTRCLGTCEEYLHSIVGDGLTWYAFENLVNKIYGDQISDDPFAPQEVHIALGDLKSTMKVMWVTMSGLEKPFAEYMPATESDWTKANVVSAVNYTYEVPKYWWEIFTGMIYETDMTSLAFETSYKYRVGGWDTANSTTRYSKEFTFKSAPDTNPNRKTVISTLADHGTFMLLGFATINKMVKLESQLNMDMVFVAGDLSYAGISSNMPLINVTKEDEFELVWDLLGIQNEPIAAKYPWMVGDGNHERFYNWSAFTNRYHMPAGSTPGYVGNFWYDFQYGNVHWISISSEHDLQDGAPQKLWLEASLQAAVANRANVPWIVASIHKPLYCSDNGTPTGYADKLEDLFIKYDVDLVLTGHLHCYERVHPVQKGVVTCLPKRWLGRDMYMSTGKGPVHVVQGNAGGMQWEGWVQPQPQWSAVRFANGFVPRNESSTVSTDGTSVLGLPPIPGNFHYTNTYGFGAITALNSTHMQYQAYADTDSNIGTDFFWIVKRV